MSDINKKHSPEPWAHQRYVRSDSDIRALYPPVAGSVFVFQQLLVAVLDTGEVHVGIIAGQSDRVKLRGGVNGRATIAAARAARRPR